LVVQDSKPGRKGRYRRKISGVPDPKKWLVFPGKIQEIGRQSTPEWKVRGVRMVGLEEFFGKRSSSPKQILKKERNRSETFFYLRVGPEIFQKSRGSNRKLLIVFKDRLK
jgi:hypothetical protein